MRADYDRHFGKRLRAMRKYRRQTAADVARAIGVSTETLLLYERGERLWRAALLNALCRHLGVRADAFLKGLPLFPWMPSALS